ncbi:MAG: hypothetical protein K2M54_07930, partial [Muribaculaceae bacterium]|nr:hypothetical protein [Muribaculaceae bacterium]
MNISQKIDKLRQRAMTLWQYGTTSVWNERKNTTKVKIIKTLNLSVRSFLSADIQSQACAMTYRTVLAIVPALAMLFALGRGFGLQTLLEKELYS